jgi:hypothetical protein
LTSSWSSARKIDFVGGLLRLGPYGRAQDRKRRPTVPLTDGLRRPLEEPTRDRQTDRVIEHSGHVAGLIRKMFRETARRAGHFRAKPKQSLGQRQAHDPAKLQPKKTRQGSAGASQVHPGKRVR